MNKPICPEGFIPTPETVGALVKPEGEPKMVFDYLDMIEYCRMDCSKKLACTSEYRNAIFNAFDGIRKKQEKADAIKAFCERNFPDPNDSKHKITQLTHILNMP